MPGPAEMPTRGMDTGYGRKDVGRYKVQPYGSGYGPMRTAEPAAKPKPKPKPEPAPSSSGGGGGSGGGSGGGGASVDKYIKKMKAVKPREREVEPEDTVQWQIDQLLEKNSPYLQRARYSGERMAQNRGLQNTSMAAQASEAAAIDAVLPIASQDANTYFSQGINNQNTVNRFRENIQRLYGNLALGEQQLDSQLALAAVNFENQRALLGDKLAHDLQLARIGLISSIMSTPGLSSAQMGNATNLADSFFFNAPAAIRNFQNI